MGSLSLTKGLNLPFKNGADFSTVREISTTKVSVDLSPYQYLHLKCEKKEGDSINAGQVLAHDIHEEERVYLSPFSGKILKIERGQRRRITAIEIELEEASVTSKKEKRPLLPKKGEFSLKDLLKSGFSFFIHKRPFHRIIGKDDVPRSIFIHAITSAPYTPSFSHLYKSHKELFQKGIDLLATFAGVHLIQNEEIFEEVENVTMHKGNGPHPIENASLHIAAFDPITSSKDVVWSLDVLDVLHIGSLLEHWHPFTKTMVAIAGDGFETKDRCLVSTFIGASIEEITGNRENIIAGDPLTGTLGAKYLRGKDRVITSFQKKEHGEFFPFLKLGWSKPTQTKAYLSGLLRRKNLAPRFETFGEERPFIVKDIYQKYFPLKIYIEPLIKAMLAKDYELAIKLGLLEVDTPDFAICEYMCPSKIALMELFEATKNEYLSSL
ncbi:hypothetical protein K0U07_00325 [bacterium]|nr:hypothetical protein [bacterium]